MGRRTWTPVSPDAAAAIHASRETVAGFDIKADLGPLLRDLKEFDPALARQIRARLRRAGDSTIEDMRALLDEYEGGTVTGWNKTLGVDKLGRARIRRTTANTAAANRARSRGSRKAISEGLKLRVTTGKSRTTIRLVATTGALRKALNTKAWRHPVFGTGEWVEQPGNQYFNRAVWGRWRDMRDATEFAIQDALDAVNAHGGT